MGQASRFHPSIEFIQASKRIPRPALMALAQGLKGNTLAGWVTGTESVYFGDHRFEALCSALGLKPGEGYGRPDQRQSDRTRRHPKRPGPAQDGRKPVPLLKNSSPLRSCPSLSGSSRCSMYIKSKSKSKKSKERDPLKRPPKSTKKPPRGIPTLKDKGLQGAGNAFSTAQPRFSRREIYWLLKDLQTCKTEAEREVIHELLSVLWASMA